MRTPKAVGALLCSHPDCCPASQRITLGQVPEATDRFYNTAGELVREITYPAQDVSISSILRDVVGYESGLCRLACGHTRAELPLISAQEYLILPNGELIRSEGLPATDSHVSHRATFKTRPRP